MTQGSPCGIVAFEHRRDRREIGLATAMEHRKSAIAQPEKAEHRGHPIERASQCRLDFAIGVVQSLLHHCEHAKRLEQGFRRTADMAAIGEDLTLNLARETLQSNGG